MGNPITVKVLGAPTPRVKSYIDNPATPFRVQDASDVAVSNPSVGQVLIWNGSQFTVDFTANLDIAQASYEQANAAFIISNAANTAANFAVTLALSGEEVISTFSDTLDSKGNTFQTTITVGDGLMVDGDNTSTDFGNTSFNITVNAATVDAPGIVQLYDAWDSGSTTEAATANVVNAVFNTLNDNTNNLFGDFILPLAIFTSGASDTANLALAIAQSANANGGSAMVRANAAYIQANAAFIQANASFSLGNSTATLLGTVYTLSNTIYTEANTALAIAISANSNGGMAMVRANAAYIQANGAYIQANASYNTINAEIAFVNTIYSFANTLSIQANAINTYANGAFNKANAGFVYANANFSLTNSTTNLVTSAYLQANSATSNANAAFIHANNAYIRANAIYLKTNAAFDLTNSTTDLVSGAYSLANLVFQRTIDINQYAQTAFGAANTTLVYSNANFNLTNSTANLVSSVYSFANTIAIQSNGVNTYAQSAFSQGNSTTNLVQSSFLQANNVNLFAQSAYVVANSALNLTQNSFNLTNSSTNLVHSAYGVANSAIQLLANTNPYAQTAYGVANSGLNLAQSAFTQANSSYLFANVAYTKANIIGIIANTTLTYVQSAYSFANTISEYANASFASTNSTTNLVASAYLAVNATNSYAQSVYGLANTTANLANNIQTITNNVNLYAQSAYGMANSAGNISISAYARANNAVGQQITFHANNGLAINSGTVIVATGNSTVFLTANNATNTTVGVVQLSDTTSSNSTSLAVTANIVNAIYITSGAAFDNSNAATFLANNANNLANSANSLATAGNIYAQGAYNAANSGLILVQSSWDSSNSIGVSLSNTNSNVNSLSIFTQSISNRANAVVNNQFTIVAAVGLVVNGAQTLTIAGNNSFVIGANVGNTTQLGIIQLNDTIIAPLANQAATANVANTIWSTANAAFIQANNVSSIAQGGYNTANIAIGNAQTASSVAASALNLALSAFSVANAGGSANGSIISQTFIAGTGLTVNSGSILSVTGNNTVVIGANNASTANFGLVKLVDTLTSTSTNTAITANIATTIWTTANAGFAYANTLGAASNAAFTQANTALNLAQIVYSAANNTDFYAHTAYGYANATANLIPAVYNRANANIQNQLTIQTNSGILANGGIALTVSGNSTIVLAANISSTTTAGIVQLNDTLTSNLANQAATANMANTIWTVANNTTNTLNIVYSFANTINSSVNAVSTYAQSAYARANLAPGLAATTYIANTGLTVNSGITITLSGNNTVILGVNSATTLVSGITQLNDTHTSVATNQAATANALAATYSFANTGVISSQAAFNSSNAVNTFTGSAYNLANTLSISTNAINGYAQSAYGLANATLNVAQAAYVTVNAVNTYAQSSYGLANTVLNIAQGAYNAANAGVGSVANAVNKTGDTMTGALNISVSGVALRVNNSVTLGALTANSINSANLVITTNIGGTGVVQVVPSQAFTSNPNGQQLNSFVYNAAGNTAFPTTGVTAYSAITGYTQIAGAQNNYLWGGQFVADYGGTGGTGQHLGVYGQGLRRTFTIQTTTVASSLGSPSTILSLTSIQSFQTYNGFPVSSFNPLPITINGNSYSCIGVSAVSGAGTITLSTNVSTSDGTVGNLVRGSNNPQIWAATFESTDLTNQPSINTAAQLSVEFDLKANDLDNSDPIFGSRQILSVVAAQANTAGAACQVGIGIGFYSVNNSSFKRILHLGAKYSVAAIDTRYGTQLAGANTIWLADNQKIAFDSAGTRTLNYDAITGNLFYGVNGANVFSIGATGNTSVSGNLSVSGTDVGAGLIRISTTANSALSSAQGAFNKANSSIQNTGGIITGTLTSNISSSGTSYFQDIIANNSVTALGNMVTGNMMVYGTINSAMLQVTSIASNTLYTLSMRDSGQSVTFNHTGLLTVNVASSLPVGYRTVLTQIGSGNVKIQAGPGVTVNSRTGSNNQILGQFGSATIWSYAANSFIVTGEVF